MGEIFTGQHKLQCQVQVCGWVWLLQRLSAMTDEIKSIFKPHCPMNCHSKCLITAHSQFNNIVVCIQVCDYRRTQTLYWGYFFTSVAKTVDLWLQSFEAPDLLQLPSKALSSFLRGEVIGKCQQNKLHGFPWSVMFCVLGMIGGNGLSIKTWLGILGDWSRILSFSVLSCHWIEIQATGKPSVLYVI